MQKSVKWLVLGTIALSTLTACDAIKDTLPSELGDLGSLTERRSSADGDRRANDDNAKNNKGSDPAKFAVDETGTKRLVEPTEEEQKLGKEVTSVKLSKIGARSASVKDNWIYQNSSAKPGRVLVAAASVAERSGGDMIRRIDLGSKVKEFDYDPETPGAQGAYILVPDEMRAAIPSKLIDGDGLFSGKICAFVPGPNKTVIALGAGGGADGGFGFVINPYEEEQAFTPLQTFHLPYAGNPCRAIYSEQLKKLYVIDAARTDSHSSLNGVFIVDIFNNGKATTGSFYEMPKSLKINTLSQNDFMSIDMYNDKLYLLSGNGRFDGAWDSVLFSVPLNDLGEPLYDKRTYVRTNNPIFMTQACGLNTYNLGQVSVVETDNGPVALTSGTTQTIAWDISGDEMKKIDLNPKKPGTQGINIEDMGRGGPKFAITPDGKEIIQMTHCHSETNKIPLAKLNSVHVFEMPSIKTKDLSLGNPIDIGYRDLLKTKLLDSHYRPQFVMTYADFAVGPQHIVLVGAAAGGNSQSGLGPGGDLTIIDRAKGTSMIFDMPADIDKAHHTQYGFKLAQGDPKFEGKEQHSYGLIWVP